MKNILVNRKNLFRLYEDDDNDLSISVLCGSIGAYEVSFKLNEEELNAYKLKGQQALIELSRKVVSNPEEYESR